MDATVTITLIIITANYVPGRNRGQESGLTY